MSVKGILRRFCSKLTHEFFVFFAKFIPAKGVIYMIHSIGDKRHSIYLEEKIFESFVERMKKRHVVRLEEWEKEKDFICLTFDDVADSFYYKAYPLLKKYNLPFTIFVCVSLLDQEKYITTSMLQEMASCKLCTVGSHGLSHKMFANFDTKTTLNELSVSKEKLENIINREVKVFAFPYGTYYACGYKNKNRVLDFYDYGFGTISMPITNHLLSGKYFLPRINVTERLVANNKY